MTERELQRNYKYGKKIGCMSFTRGSYSRILGGTVSTNYIIKKAMFIKHIKWDKAKIWIEGNKNMCIKHCNQLVKIKK